MKPNPDGIVGLIARIRELSNLLIEDELQARQIHGLKPAHGSVLAFLFRQTEPVPIKEVVEHVGRVKSTVTGMINTLDRHGYVRKTPSQEDARVIFVELTKKGLALKPDFEEISVVLRKKLYGTMPRRDRERLVDGLAEIRQNLEGDA
jgi:DNA-binding MarR family transcriptional regulator